MRYVGQGYELRVPWRKNAGLLQDFHAAHQRRFGYHHPAREVEAVTLRVRASLPQTGAHSSGLHPRDKATESKPQSASVYFGGKAVRSRILDRRSMAGKVKASGPLIITEYTATTAVPPGWNLSLHRSGALILETSRS
jgi:N-methylhydantoinase A